MTMHPGRTIDFELLALDSGLFDTLPPPKPLSGRAVDYHVMRLQSGLFDTLPPAPSLRAMYDSLAPVIEAERRGKAPAPAASRRRRGAATTIGACAGLALMALGVGLRHREAPAEAPAAAPAVAPWATPTIVLPEIVITSDLHTEASEPPPAKPAAARTPSNKPAAAPRTVRR